MTRFFQLLLILSLAITGIVPAEAQSYNLPASGNFTVSLPAASAEGIKIYNPFGRNISLSLSSSDRICINTNARTYHTRDLNGVTTAASMRYPYQAGAMVAVINKKHYLAGTNMNIVLPARDTLTLLVNDCEGCYFDNDGIAQVNVRMEHSSEELVPGFEPEEYLEMLSISAQLVDSIWQEITPNPSQYELVYHSPESGLHNCWDLWVSKSKTTMVVSLRGTINQPNSWLENFYATMVPATGKLKLSDSNEFEYKLADDPKAAVHIGWLLGIGCMAPDIMSHIKTQYDNGIKQLIIMGHSQGGAMAYFLHSYLYYKNPRSAVSCGYGYKNILQCSA